MFHRNKANCFAEKAITDNRLKTFAKSVKTIAAKVLISTPDPVYEIVLIITANVTLG